MAVLKQASTPEVKPAPAAIEAKAGETPSDRVYLGDKKVRNRYSWRPAADGPKYTKESVFDFTGCTEEQILFLALDSATIKVQAHLRNAANGSKDLKVDPNLFTNVNVLNDVILASTRADPVASAIAQARKAGASEAVVKALAEDLAKQAKK